MPSESDDSALAYEIFDRASEIICAELKKRKKSRQVPTLLKDRPNFWLRPVSYHLISQFLNSDQVEVFVRRAINFGRYSRGEHSGLNHFQLGLMAIFAHDRDVLRERDRERFGRQMAYAYSHFVPTPFLNGFLYEHRGWERASGDVIEISRELREWVIVRLVGDFPHEGESVEHRGSYPEDINSAVGLRSPRGEKDRFGKMPRQSKKKQDLKKSKRLKRYSDWD